MDLHSQIASILEVLANAAVAEICKLVDDGYALVQLELNQNHKENEFLKRKVKLLELQVARYRGNRMRGPDAFPGVRLINRQQRDTLTGSSGQSRSRFLNRTPGNQSVPKTPPINLDQDLDQEVVTTTKTESVEPEAEEGELLIVKVESAMETSAARDRPAESSRDATVPPGGLEEPAAGQRSQTEVDLKRERSPEIKEVNLKQIEAGSSSSSEPPQNLAASRTLHLFTQDTQQPPPSAQIWSHFPSVAKKTNGSDEETVETNFDIIVMDSLLDRTDSNGDVTPLSSWIRGGKGGVTMLQTRGTRDVVHHGSQRSADVFDQSNILPPSIAMATAEPQPQHQTLSHWPGYQEAPAPFLPQLTINHPSSTNPNPCHQPSTSQNQGMGLIEQPLPPYPCSFCGRRYAHLCQLRIHERVHTGEKPYQCSQCGKRFGQFCSLKRHQMVHTGEKPHRCSQCGKQFSTANNLKVHQSVHTGEKRFHCSQCGKLFSFLSNLIRHQAIHAAKTIP